MLMPVYGNYCPYHAALDLHNLVDYRTLAITPLKSLSHKWDEVVRVCQEYPLYGLKAMAEARGSRTKPFRFMYMSGDGAPRDMSKKPVVLRDYLLMRV